jgi:hypothetical protein
MANLKQEIRSNDATDASVARVDMKLELVTNTALTGATYDVDGGQQLVAG